MALAAVAADLKSEGLPERLALGLLALGALAIGLAVAFTPLGQGALRLSGDLQARLLAPQRPPERVLVLDIDEPTLAALQPVFGPWPWRRDVHALVIDRLRELGARAIALDILMTDPRPGDESLARALQRPGAPVVLAAAGSRHASDGESPPPLRGSTAAPAAAASSPTSPTATTASKAVPAFVWPHILEPAVTLRPPDAPVALGIITGPLDDDGVLRHVPAWHRAEGAPDTRWPGMPLAMLALSGGPDAVQQVPLDRQGRILLAAPRAEARVETLPLAALFERWAAPAQAPAVQRLSTMAPGSTVFVGSSALLADTVMTLQGQVTGTQALALAYAGLRDRQVLRPLGGAWLAGGLLLALAPVGWALRRGRTDRRGDLMAVGLVLAAGTAVSAAVWADGPWVLPLAAPLATLASGALGLSLRDAARTRQAQRRLRRQLALAEAAAQAKTQFLTTVSHEMRTPLNALLGVAELLDDSPLSREQRRQVGLFREAGHSLLTLINDLLDLSKIEAGKLVLQPGRVNLQRVLDDLVSLMRPRAQAKGLVLALRTEGDLPAEVWIDRQRLLQALTNLLGNAVKFTAVGAVTLRATCNAAGPALPERPGPARAAPRQWLHLAVEDTGIGIAADRLGEVFEPFSQADASIARDYGGTGLGLSLTRQIARAMGGEVDVVSAPGRGSTFTLHLPCIAPPPLPERPAALGEQEVRPDPRTPSPPAPAEAPRRVLLAEDNEVNTYLFCAMLSGPDLVIETAADGLAAWTLLEADHYDIAFIDVQMPGMDGLTLTRRLRSFEAGSDRPRTPVVALTANAFASDVQASLQAGCDHHLPKPFTREMLREAIDRWARVAADSSR